MKSYWIWFHIKPFFKTTYLITGGYYGVFKFVTFTFELNGTNFENIQIEVR